MVCQHRNMIEVTRGFNADGHWHPPILQCKNCGLLFKTKYLDSDTIIVPIEIKER